MQLQDPEEVNSSLLSWDHYTKETAKGNCILLYFLKMRGCGDEVYEVYGVSDSSANLSNSSTSYMTLFLAFYVWETRRNRAHFSEVPSYLSIIVHVVGLTHYVMVEEFWGAGGGQEKYTTNL